MNKILNLLMLFVILTIGNNYVVNAQETKSFSFKQTSRTTGNLTGAPKGVKATFENSDTGDKFRITSGDSIKLTISGLAEGITITGVRLKVHNNATAGDGRATITLGNKTWFIRHFE